MLKGIGRYVRRHHVGLLALMIVVAGGTAYAAGLAKNSVKSKQIKNNAVASVDLKDGDVGSVDLGDGAVGSGELADGSIGPADLANGSVNAAKIADGSIGAAKLDPNSVADVITRSGTFPSDGPIQDILTVAGMGTLRLNCGDPDSRQIQWVYNGAEPEYALLFGHDALDNNPVGAADDEGTSVSLGLGGSSGFSVLKAEVWVRKGDRVLKLDVLEKLFGTNTDCSYQVQGVLDANDA